MQDMFFIEDVDQAMILLKPMRIDILKRLGEPHTCPELGTMLGESAQKIYYHIKALENAGLVEKVEERRVRGTIEGYYQARARSYWLAPQLVGEVGTPQMSQDQTSLRVMLELAEEVQRDVGRLGHRTIVGQHVPSLSLSAHIYLPDGTRRAAFLAELQDIFEQLARKYGTAPVAIEAESFRLVLMVYPKQE